MRQCGQLIIGDIQSLQIGQMRDAVWQILQSVCVQLQDLERPHLLQIGRQELESAMKKLY